MNETGSACSRVVVATEGSESSLGAVARAGAPAGARGATLVVGNHGPAGTRGRLLGSVPAGATRRSAGDVVVVHTTG